MSQVVQLEAFESPLRARRIRWFIHPGQGYSYPPGFQEQCFTESPPFTRRILLTSPQSSEAWKLTDKWDWIMMPASPTDWSLVLTVVLHQPSPCLVVCTPELQVPPAVFQKIAQAGQKAATVICLTVLQLPIPASPILFDAVFFPPMKTMDDGCIEAIETVLPQLMSSDKLRGFVVKDALKDLRGAGATLVVSRIEESEVALYWYYASESRQRRHDIVSSVIQTLLQRDI